MLFIAKHTSLSFINPQFTIGNVYKMFLYAIRMMLKN